MNTGRLELKVKRISSRKRSRNSLKTHLTPASKRGEGPCPQECFPDCRDSRTMAEGQAVEFCSDSEDLFGDYDSILEDSSLLAKLDDAEQNARRPNGQISAHNDAVDQPEFTVLWLMKDIQKRPSEDILSDSILDRLGDEPFEDLPPSQLQFQDKMKRSRLQEGEKTSTPSKNTDWDSEGVSERTTEEKPKKTLRRSVADKLKKTMLGNAATPSSVSRTVVLKEAVVSEEISVAIQAMETVSSQTTDLGPFFGLPSKVKDLMYELRGIKTLYDWQETCLNLDCVQRRKNLIYSLPTSGGKTLVAEILILRELLCRKKDCLFILPYISLVQEKVRGLASFGLELDFMVEEYAGSKGRFPPVKRRTMNSLYIATIEKAHSLVNLLIETDRIGDLGLVVVDELHMLGDGNRGAIIEMTLSKVLYTSQSTQIIGMSATLGNIQDLQTFLKAENYTNDFRPVHLKEYVKLNEFIYEVDPKEEPCFRLSHPLNFKYSSGMQKTDPDHIIALVTEVIPSHSCLVFCPTKKNCENLVGMICRHLREDFLQYRHEEKLVLLQELKYSGNGSLCPILRRTVPYGLAYHHSGLTSEERKLVEEAYSSGVLCLLTCTSTLAAGINLPARRVILRSPYVATDFLKRSQYKQMVGRAGRAGIDTVGESILILQEKDRHMAQNLVSAPMERCLSHLIQDQGKGLLSLILSLIGLKVTSSCDQLRDFLCGTLLYVQQEELCVRRSLWEEVQQSLDLLREKNLITESADRLSLEVTGLGRATYKASVDLDYSEVLYRDLSKGLEGLLLNSYLHLVYLVTPYDLVSQVKPDWMTFYRQFTLLTSSEQKMSSAVGVPESFVARKAAGQAVKKSVDMEVVSRMYLALVLFSLLKETNLWGVAERFQLSRGFVQSLLSSSSAFCSCVLHFTEELEELWPFRALLSELTKRLSFCVRAELIPLMEVAGVMEFRAKQLYNAGYKTLTHLANADPSVLCKTIENLFKKQANQMVASAKMLLNEKAAALQEEVEELLTMPADLPQVNWTSSEDPNLAASLDRSSSVTRRVEPRFLSVTIDASLASEEKFMYLLGSPKLRTLARALTPAFLRFGGTRQDFMVFTPQSQGDSSGSSPAALTCAKLELPPWLEEKLKKEWTRQQVLLMREDLGRKYRSVKFTENTIDMLHSFANCSGMDLIFGLNALLRTAENTWNSSNARSLLHYCESREYRMSWELGNEPNSYEKKAGIRVDGRQLGEDFTRLREMMSQSKLYHDAGLYGPDVGQPRDHRTDIMQGFLQSGAEAVDAVTWHHYYVNGRDTSLEDFLNPDILDTLTLKTTEVLETVKLESPRKPVWLGETGSAFGGGAIGLSDTFVAGFMWLDKLGLAAKLGLDVVMRQVLVGSGSYHLVDENLDPLPDYWLSVLYKRLVGPEVLKIEGFHNFARHKRVRLYLHCAHKNRYRRGAITLISMNLSNKAVRISVPARLSSSTVEAFVLESAQPGEEGLYSRSVTLNRNVLKMVDDQTLPDLKGVCFPPSEHLQFPAYSLAFFVFIDAAAAACF
ncbi:hypothetical protein NFI96_018502%2C partial [Xyrichtys novacula]|uniref:Helicase POLQ-like n=1 Tax=Xyrichtys novacula TaxID=13765 RepID=A0AAV1G924_XYRNO|nr:hypothetical protein NFI96_018502%2C partial [Xyrichtys novacula]